MNLNVNKKLRQIIGSSLGADIVEVQLEKAIKESKDVAYSTPQSMFYDPLALFMGREWLVKQRVPLNYQDLRQMAKNPIINSIVQTRLNQIAAFCIPQAGPYDQGYIIKADDPTADKDLVRKKEISDFIHNCGELNYGDDLFEGFVRKYLRDSLTMDQACAEIVNRRNGEPAYWVATDSATMRKLKSTLKYQHEPGEKLYGQLLNDVIVAEYSDEQMLFGIRNPQTDITYCGYGMAELETLVRVVTTILNTERYNSGQLAQGGTSKGVFVVQGDHGIDPVQFESFKRDLREAIRNAADFWRPPVLRIGKDGKVDWVQLDRANRDMEYAQLFDFLVKQACGVYQISSEEINWVIGSAGGKVTFEGGGGAEAKLSYSQKKGLRPLLTFLQNVLNLKIIQRIDRTQKYRIEFVGLALDRNDDSEVRAREVQNYKTVNQVREEMGWKKLKGGDVVLNQFYMKSLEYALGLSDTLSTGSGGGGDSGAAATPGTPKMKGGVQVSGSLSTGEETPKPKEKKKVEV